MFGQTIEGEIAYLETLQRAAFVEANLNNLAWFTEMQCNINASQERNRSSRELMDFLVAQNASR